MVSSIGPQLLLEHSRVDSRAVKADLGEWLEILRYRKSRGGVQWMHGQCKAGGVGPRERDLPRVIASCV
jgi:hypothetical protein